MTNYMINEVYSATEKLSENKELSDSVLWCLYKLRKDLRIHVDFYKEREQDIKDKYISYVDENGQIHGEIMNQYLHELEDLNNMDKDVSNITKYTISLKDINGITVHDMESLEAFIEFTNE